VTDRRKFVCGGALGALTALPLRSGAQRAQKVARIAFLYNNVPVADMMGAVPAERTARAFVRGLHELGFVDGRNIVIERRSAEGQPGRIPALVQEVVSLKVDVLVTAGSPMSRAAKQATDTIPIVAVATRDPVALGLATSLARPGGNVTGLTIDTGAGLEGKRLELLKEAVPTLVRVAVMRPRSAPGQPARDPEIEAAAQALGLILQWVAVDGPEEFKAAFASIARSAAQAIFATGSPLYVGPLQRRQIIDFAAKQGLPTIGPWREFPESGGLMSYGPDNADLFRRAAAYVAKILEGARPGELPIEQPTKFELVVNLKTAKALGLTMPQSLLLRADEVIG
jgi:putative ABC transport system substrate-binding protein